MNFFVSVKESLSQSAKELKKLPSLTGASMLLALDVILSFFFRLELSQTLRVGISFVARGACGMLYGPVVLSLSAAAGDLIKYVLKPTGPYFWGFTFNAALAGLISGLFLYKGKVSVWRVVAAKGLVNVLVNGVLGTYWKTLLYGKAFMVTVVPSVVKNITMLPIECLILYVSLKAFQEVFRRLKKL